MRLSLPAIPEPTAPAPANHFVSIESIKNAMEDILKDDNNSINIVGVHGMARPVQDTLRPMKKILKGNFIYKYHLNDIYFIFIL